jgi:hypothetical protein
LAREAESWVESGLIAEAQRRGIMDSYLAAGNLFAILLSLAVAMLGLGLLSFVAANWQSLPAAIKIVLVVGLYAAAVGGALVCESRAGRAPADALLLLSGFVLLGGLALMAQIYHLSVPVQTIFGTWLVAFAPTLLLARNVPLFALYETAAIAYMNIKAFDSGSSRFDFAEMFNPRTLVLLGWPTFLLLFLAVLAWPWRRAAVAQPSGAAPAPKRIPGGDFRRLFLWNFFLIDWFVCLCALNSRGETLLPFVLGILALGCLINLTAWKLDAGCLDLQGLFCVALSGLALTFPWAWEWKTSEFWRSPAWPVAASVALGIYLVSRILRRLRFGGFSAFLFCVVLMRWFADIYQAFASKTLFFTLGGAILLAVALAYRRWAKGAGGDAAPAGGGNADAVD